MMRCTCTPMKKDHKISFPTPNAITIELKRQTPT